MWQAGGRKQDARPTQRVLCEEIHQTMAVAAVPRVHLVLCRLFSEDIGWATDSIAMTNTKMKVFVYNAGPPLQLSPDAASKVDVRALKQGGHESFCYLEHILQSLHGGGNFAAATVFAPATPRCIGMPAPACTQQITDALHMLREKNATIEPNGYAPINPSPIADFWHDVPLTLTCLPAQYEQLSNGRHLDSDADFFSFSSAGSFAVGRKNLLSAPRGWLRRAQDMLGNASLLSSAAGIAPTSRGEMHLCCNPERTCVPWLLERLWPMLLNTPHRGCNGVRTGYCATEWNPKHKEGVDPHSPLALPRFAPREGAGAIKLRNDVARVSRVARFANELSQEERSKFMELIAAENPRRRDSKALPSCTTQLCAIVTLLNKARANDDEDFALYLASAVNTSELSPDAPERLQRRCRQLFVDKKVLVEGVERIQPRRNAGLVNILPGPSSASEEHRSGQLLHSAIQKVYAACIRQMVVDPRWYQRPFVYGFAKEDDKPVPTFNMA